ncbi:nicotinate-nucleotide--dimethylbenzimidazole phosphoribosyltransferase [Streptomyces sp. NPDC002851]
MTDTGQVPGEGLPESAGTVEQPGAHAPGAYTYLDPSGTPADDDDLLLMPGAQGAWTEGQPGAAQPVAPQPVAAPAQEPAAPAPQYAGHAAPAGPEQAAPVAESAAAAHDPRQAAPAAPAPAPVAAAAQAAHQPGAHEASGRDSGSIDLGAAGALGGRGPAPHTGPAPQHATPGPQQAAPSRRPLHLGPPTPAASAGTPVRSLADRGPAGTPQPHRQGPPTVGPEYLDVPREDESAGPAGPQRGELPPQNAMPWPEPQAQPQPEAQGAAGNAAETVVPEVTQDPQAAQAPQSSEVPHVTPQAVPVPEASASRPAQPEQPEQQPESAAGPAPDAEAPAPQMAETPAGGVPQPQPVELSEASASADGATPVGGTPMPEPVGQFVPVEGSIPSTPHLAPTPPHALHLPQAAQPEAAQEPEADAPDGSATAEQPTDADADADADDVTPTAPAAPEPPSEEGALLVAAPAQEPVATVPAPRDGDAPVPAPEATGTPDSPNSPETPASSVPTAPAQTAPPATPATPENGENNIVDTAPTAEPAPTPDAPATEPGPAPTPESPDTSATPEGPEFLEPAEPEAVEAPAQPAAPVQPANSEQSDQPEQTEQAGGTEQPVQVDQSDEPDQQGQPQQPEGSGQPAPAETADAPVGPEATEVTPATPENTEAPEAVEAAETLETVAAAENPTATEAPEAPANVGTSEVLETSEAPETPASPATAEAPGTAEAPEANEPSEAPETPEALEAPEAPESAETSTASETPEATEAINSTEATHSTEATEPPHPPSTPAPGYDEAEREAVLRVMRERRDIRNGFRSDPIPHEVLLRVLEAAHTAPSVGHSQPWDFVVIRSAETRQKMHELAMRQREAYAKSLPKGRAKQFKELKIEAILDTPVNIVVTADPTRGGRHTLGRHTQPQMAPYSSALAVENLWLAARAEGLGVGWVSFFDEREMVRSLDLPEHLEVVAYLCVGYVDEFPDEPELMQAGWSKRRPLSWVVHEETYGRRALPGEDPHDLLAETVAGIRPLDAKALGEAWERQKRMTKPAGALGMLEIISAQLSGLSRMCPPPVPEPAAVAIFAGDHGVHAQGVTPWPQEVTGQMVANFLGGGAVCNAFANQVGAEVCVIDVGVASDLPATPGLLPRKVRAGTADMTTGPALSREEVKEAIEVGIDTARDLVAAGNKALLTGEMGIANTTASAALISVYTGADPTEVTGRGTGVNDETLARKTDVVRRALELHQPDPADPIGVLAAIGGLEHAAMVGLLLGGASLRTPVILDGVSAGAAALVARAIAPEVLAACIAGHRSAEPGHVAALKKLGLRPLVELDLRLGEGTGALLALPVVQSAARAMHEVATFDSAGVTEK